MSKEFEDFKQIIVKRRRFIKDQNEKNKQESESSAIKEQRRKESLLANNKEKFKESGILDILNGVIENKLLGLTVYHNDIYTFLTHRFVEHKRIVREKARLEWSEDGSNLYLYFNEFSSATPENFGYGDSFYDCDYLHFFILNNKVALYFSKNEFKVNDILQDIEHDEFRGEEYITDIKKIMEAVADVIIKDESSYNSSIYKRHRHTSGRY